MTHKASRSGITHLYSYTFRSEKFEINDLIFRRLETDVFVHVSQQYEMQEVKNLENVLVGFGVCCITNAKFPIFQIAINTCCCVVTLSKGVDAMMSAGAN